MDLQILPKQEAIPDFDPNAIRLRHVEYYPSDGVYEEDAITETLIAQILQEIPEGIGVYLSLDPYGEDEFLEVLCDREWLALGYVSGGDVFYSYNPAFAGSDALSPLESGGQSPVEKRLALQDLPAGVKAVEYFIRTGLRYPGIDWAKQL